MQLGKAQQLTNQMASNDQTRTLKIKVLLTRIEAYYWKAEYDHAIVVCDEGEQLCQKGEFKEEQAYILYWRAKIAATNAAYGNAVQPAKQALDLLGTSPTNRKLQASLYSLLGGLSLALPTDEMLEYLNNAFSIAEEDGFFDVQAETLMRRSWIEFFVKENPINALDYAKQSLDIAKQNGMIQAQVFSHYMMVYSNLRFGYREEVLLQAEQAVTVAQKYGVPISLHWALDIQAVAIRQVNENWLESLKTIKKSIAIADNYNFTPLRDAVAVGIHTAIGLGLWKIAEELQERFYKTVNTSYPRSLGFLQWQQGLLNYAQGLFMEAVEQFEKAFISFKQPQLDDRDCRMVQPFLGLALIEIGELHRATEVLEEALLHWQDKHPARFAQSLRGLAKIHLKRGNLERSIENLEKALIVSKDSYDENSAWPVNQLVSVDLGYALYMAGQTEEALSHAMFAYDKFKKWGHFLLGESAFVVGQILALQGKRDEALIYLNKARNDWQRLELTHHLSAWEKFVAEHRFV